MKEFKLILKVWDFPLHGTYKKYGLDESDTYNAYKTFHFVSNTGEVGVLDCSENIPQGVESIKNMFDNLVKKEYDFKEYKINGLRQDAWRFFADKSTQGSNWHKHHMSGTPFKNNLSDEELYSIKLLSTEELLVKAQDVTFTKWLGLPDNEQKKHMKLFLDNPVKGSDYLFKNTFY